MRASFSSLVWAGAALGPTPAHATPPSAPPGAADLARNVEDEVQGEAHAPSQTEDRAARAERWFLQGEAAAGRGEFAAAAEAFRRSDEAYPTEAAAFNRGRSLQYAGRPLEARRIYLELEGRLEPGSPGAREAAAVRAELESQLARIESLEVDPGAELRIDGRGRSIDELPIFVSPGEVYIEARTPGEPGEPSGSWRSVRIDATPGDPIRLDLRTPPAPSQDEQRPLEAPTLTPLPGRAGPTRAWGGVALAGVGLGLGGGGLGVAFGLRAQATRQAFSESACQAGSCLPASSYEDPQQISDRFDTEVRASNLGWSLAAAGLVVATVGGALWLRARRARSSSVVGWLALR